MKRQHHLHALLAAGLMAAGLTTNARAFTPGAGDTNADPAAGVGPGKDAKPKVEERVIITTVEREDGAPGTTTEIPVFGGDGRQEGVIVRRQGGERIGGPGGLVPRQQQYIVQTITSDGSEGDAGAAGGQGTRFTTRVRSVQRDGEIGEAGGKEAAWLGVSAEEPSDALTSQLSLLPGEGLLVTYVAPDSPAAKAGLRKNDLLLEMDGQKLVLPAQLRKLVQMRKEGDKVELSYYRGGKKQAVSAALGKTKVGFAFSGGLGGGMSGGIGGGMGATFTSRIRQTGQEGTGGGMGGGGGGGTIGRTQIRTSGLETSKNGVDEALKQVGETLASAGVDQENIKAEVLRRVEEATRAAAAAVAQARDIQRNTERPPRALEELARNGVEVGKNATVSVKSRSESVRTMVNADETGSYVIVANPRKHLTAHDKDGKLVFDGAIETSDEQNKVPREVWKKVQPMIEQLDQAPPTPPTPKTPAAKKTTAETTVDPLRQTQATS